MSEQAEHALLREARDGESTAFDDLQAQLEPAVRRFVRRLIGLNPAEDDIVQDVFMALYENMARIDPVENLRPYLFRIARNRCYDELRAQGRFQMVSLDEEPVNEWVSLNVADGGPEPDEAVHWLFVYFEVQDAIDRLPELQREALLLHAEENLSYAEIAEVMNTGIGTVKSRLYYAKRALRGLLRPELLALLTEEFEWGER